MQEELEVPHQRRVALLEAEVEKHRHVFCKARREHERCKVRSRAFVGPHEQEQLLVAIVSRWYYRSYMLKYLYDTAVVFFSWSTTIPMGI